jgi:hypothetical protein
MIKTIKKNSPEKLALEHIESGNPTTSEVINSLLFNPNISIRQEELNKLLEIPSVKFKLPFSDQTYPALATLVGKPQSRRFSNIYIFTHIPSGMKYVGV